MNKIAVIGAGPMGLAVAYQLAQKGLNPIVFETDDRVGGMAACFNFNGLEIERYYHFHCISDAAFLRIICELGIQEKMHWVNTKMGFWFRGKLHPWGDPIALLRFPGLSLVAKIRYGLHAYLATKREDWRPLDRLSAIDWIRSRVGKEAYEVLWSKLFEYKFYDYSNNISAAWIWSRIRRIGRSRYNLFREKLGYLEGGSSTLLNAMATEIHNKGGKIRLGMPVQKVVIEHGQVRGLMINGELEEFDKIVSTVPMPYLPKLIPDLPMEILEKLQLLKNIAVVCVIVKLRRSVTQNFWLNINDPEMDIPGIIEYSNLMPLSHHVVYVPFYMPGEHEKFTEPDSTFLDKVKLYLRKINPILTDQDFIDLRVNRYRYAQPICEPGHLNNLPALALPVKGLWAADTSYYYPEDRGISESIAFGIELAKSVLK
jgi:protoporphyrinogen oxidase